MKKIAVIIPYFQRSPGLLRRAVESVLAQDVPGEVGVDVVIADDASPCPPEAEIAGLDRPGFSVKIIKRPNGGPAKARNTALAAAGDADFIAFLDSDDIWQAGHLETALRALAGEAAFYFSENYYEPGRTWFSTLGQSARLLAEAHDEGGGVYSIDNETLRSMFIYDCLAHTSTVVLNARRLAVIRFDTAQTHGGEDYIFWLTAITQSRRSAFCTEPKVHRGRGIDLCRGAYDWSSPLCARRIYYDLLLGKKIIRDFSRSDEERTKLAAETDTRRRELLSVLIRNSLVHARHCLPVWAQLTVNDPAFFLKLPGNGLAMLSGRLTRTARKDQDRPQTRSVPVEAEPGERRPAEISGTGRRAAQDPGQAQAQEGPP